MTEVLTNRDEQLSFAVAYHPDFEPGRHRLTGTIQIGGQLGVTRDFNSGDMLKVIVEDQHGQRVASAHVIVSHPTFKDVFEKGVLLGTERKHVATVDPDA